MVRKCSVEGCNTILSSYNNKNKCLRHQPFKFIECGVEWPDKNRIINQTGIFISDYNYNGYANIEDY